MHDRDDDEPLRRSYRSDRALARELSNARVEHMRRRFHDSARRQHPASQSNQRPPEERLSDARVRPKGEGG